MILVTRLIGPPLAINADLIERAEATPDTVLTLVDGTKYLVAETVEEIIERMRDHRAGILVRAAQMEREADAPAAVPRPLRVLGDSEAGELLMDPGSLIGIVVALVAVFASMMMDGGNPASLIAPAALLLTFGGTFGVGMASAAMSDTKRLGKVLKVALAGPKVEPQAAVTEIVGYAEKARREGLLALEEDAKKVEDPFLRKGLEMAVDGTDPEQLREILEADIASMRSRHRAGAKFFADMGGFAPTLGIIGTVIGLIHVLQNLSTPGKLGPMISAAFTATLWGVLQANIFWLPIANKLRRASELEVSRMELLLEGIVSIQGGANPRVVHQRLLSFLDPAQRDAGEGPARKAA